MCPGLSRTRGVQSDRLRYKSWLRHFMDKLPLGQDCTFPSLHVLICPPRNPSPWDRWENSMRSFIYDTLNTEVAIHFSCWCRTAQRVPRAIDPPL